MNIFQNLYVLILDFHLLLVIHFRYQFYRTVPSGNFEQDLIMEFLLFQVAFYLQFQLFIDQISTIGYQECYEII